MASPCPKCQGRMTPGSLLHTDGGRRTLVRWLEGPTIKSFWSGVKLMGRKPIDTQSLRCTRCGFLELYAPD